MPNGKGEARGSMKSIMVSHKESWMRFLRARSVEELIECYTN